MKSTGKLPKGQTDSYRSCLTKPTRGKRARRSKAEIEQLKEVILAVCEKNQPLTVRQAFYRLVVCGAVEKTQNEYKNTVGRLIGEMRDQGEMPWQWIVDATRVVRQPRTYDDLTECLEATRDLYRRNMWQMMPFHVQIWCESESAAGVLEPITKQWNVPLIPARGFSSRTLLYCSAQKMRRSGKENFLYYFGDYDPSGVHIDRDIQTKLVRYGAGDFEFVRVSVTPRQIKEMNLPSTPAKKSDSRSRNFEGEAVEIEAIPPDELRRICESCITAHIDDGVVERNRVIEDAERESLEAYIESRY